MAQIAAALRGATITDYPATASVAHLLPVKLEDSFALCLETILDGLEQLRQREAPPSAGGER